MSIKRDWEEFWFRTVPAGPVALVRIGIGLLILAGAFQLWPDRFVWFSEHGVLNTMDALQFNHDYTPGPRVITLLYVAPDWFITAFFVVYMLAAVLMIIGLWTRPALFLVWLGLNAIHNRNMVVNTTGGDQLLLIMTAYLFFTRSDAAMSVSRLLRIRAGKEGVDAPMISIWPQRLMQLQVSIVYLSTFLNKSTGTTWQHGTASYLPYMVKEFHRFPIPWMTPDHMGFIQFVTFATLAVELAMGTLVWVPRLRLYVLGLGVLLHLGIEYTMNIPLFAFTMFACYCAFLNQRDLLRFQRWLKKRLRITIPNATALVDVRTPNWRVKDNKVVVGSSS